MEGKACGEDNSTPEVIERCSLDGEILECCNNALIEGNKPDQLSIINIIPILKTGNKKK